MLKQQSFTHSIFMQSLKCFADKNDVAMSIICNNNIFVVNSVQGFNNNEVFVVNSVQGFNNNGVLNTDVAFALIDLFSLLIQLI
jgi:hypothetical protein